MSELNANEAKRYLTNDQMEHPMDDADAKSWLQQLTPLLEGQDNVQDRMTTIKEALDSRNLKGVDPEVLYQAFYGQPYEGLEVSPSAGTQVVNLINVEGSTGEFEPIELEPAELSTGEHREVTDPSFSAKEVLNGAGLPAPGPLVEQTETDLPVTPMVIRGGAVVAGAPVQLPPEASLTAVPPEETPVPIGDLDEDPFNGGSSSEEEGQEAGSAIVASCDFETPLPHPIPQEFPQEGSGLIRLPTKLPATPPPELAVSTGEPPAVEAEESLDEEVLDAEDSIVEMIEAADASGGVSLADPPVEVSWQHPEPPSLIAGHTFSSEIDAEGEEPAIEPETEAEEPEESSDAQLLEEGLSQGINDALGDLLTEDDEVEAEQTGQVPIDVTDESVHQQTPPGEESEEIVVSELPTMIPPPWYRRNAGMLVAFALMCMVLITFSSVWRAISSSTTNGTTSQENETVAAATPQTPKVHRIQVGDQLPSIPAPAIPEGEISLEEAVQSARRMGSQAIDMANGNAQDHRQLAKRVTALEQKKAGSQSVKKCPYGTQGRCLEANRQRLSQKGYSSSTIDDVMKYSSCYQMCPGDS